MRDDDEQLAADREVIKGRSESGDKPMRPEISEEKSFIERGSTVGNGQQNTESMLLDDDWPGEIFLHCVTIVINVEINTSPERFNVFMCVNRFFGAYLQT